MKTVSRPARRALGLVGATLLATTMLAACEVYPTEWTHTFTLHPKTYNPNPTLDQHLSTGWKIAATVSPFGNSGDIGYFFTRPVDLPEGVYPSAWEQKLVSKPKTFNPAGVIAAEEPQGWELAATVEPIGSSGDVGYLFQRPTASAENYPTQWEHTMFYQPKSVNVDHLLDEMGQEGWELTAAVGVIGTSGNIGYFLKRPVVGPSFYPSRWEHTFFLKPKTFNPTLSIQDLEAQGWELVAAVTPLGKSSEVGYFFKRALPEDEQ